ncbi:hypothetical protein OSTOST_16810, partial [Ostertagia ostertagi]
PIDKSTGTTIVSSTPSVESGFDPAEFGASLCEIQRLKEPAATSSPLPKSDDEAASPGSWSANLDLVYPPRFSDEMVGPSWINLTPYPTPSCTHLHNAIEPQHLPKPFKKIASMMCSKCFLEISANLTEQPRVEINAKQGARVELAGDVLLQFQGREELYSLINATTRLHVTLKPTIRHSTFG